MPNLTPGEKATRRQQIRSSTASKMLLRAPSQGEEGHPGSAAHQAAPGRPSQIHRGRRVAGGLAALFLISGVAWLSLRRFAPALVGGVPAEPLDLTELRLRCQAAWAPRDPRPCRELGDRFLAEYRPFSALWEYQEALARQPQDADSRLGLARAAANLTQYHVAATALRSLLAKGPAIPPAVRLGAARNLAAIYLHTAQPEQTIAVLRPLCTALPDLNRDLARAYYAAGEFPVAEVAYRRILRTDANARDAQLGLAQTYLAWNCPGAAIRLLTDESRRGPPDADIWLLLAKAYAAQPGGLGQAEKSVSKAMMLRPDSAPIYYQAGLLSQRKGDHVAAAEHFQQAFRLDPRHADAHRALAHTLCALGQARRSWQEMAEYYALRDQPDRVLAALTAGNASLASDTQTASRMIAAYMQLGQGAGEMHVAEQAVREHPDDPRLLFLAMQVHAEPSSRKALETLCQRWERERPGSGDPARFRGQVALAVNHFPDAIRLFKIAVARDPKRADYCALLGEAYAAIPTAENLRRARPWLEKAVLLDPNNPTVRINLGQLLARVGQPEAARRQLLRALDLSPELRYGIFTLHQLCAPLCLPAHAALMAELIKSLETRQRALWHRQRLVRDQPQDAAARDALARELAHVGQLSEAHSQWERAAEQTSQVAYRRALARIDRLREVLHE
jgi:tetratricopeptide (TPR) repeat protein